jgi:hypothetical protein
MLTEKMSAADPQHDVQVPFARTITDITGTSHRIRRNGDTPVGYSGTNSLKEGAI